VYCYYSLCCVSKWNEINDDDVDEIEPVEFEQSGSVEMLWMGWV